MSISVMASIFRFDKEKTHRAKRNRLRKEAGGEASVLSRRASHITAHQLGADLRTYLL